MSAFVRRVKTVLNLPDQAATALSYRLIGSLQVLLGCLKVMFPFPSA
jgi:hypothetical protein